jgi:hypothetical protein
MADTVEDIEEAVVDDIDTNKTADPDAEADWIKSKITLQYVRVTQNYSVLK